MNDRKMPTELEFSKKYDREHAQQYYHKHQANLARRLSNWREQRIARKSLQLAGNPQSVLDLPCGAGRFWPLLASDDKRKILAADNSQSMLDVAREQSAPSLNHRIETFQTSAFDICLKDRSVDCIFCMRLLHHIGAVEHRLELLREFHRVTANTVILSLWIEGNHQAKKRKRLEATRREQGKTPKVPNRFVMPSRKIEAEFIQSGFKIVGHFDFLKYISMWRIYVLQRV